MSKKVTNTEQNPKPEWLGGGNPRAIEAQELIGQSELEGSLQLPINCNHPSETLNTVEQYHKMGIKTFTRTKNDDIFVGVKLPTGWKKQSTEHPMWTDLLDDKGRIRANIFYKGSFHDRSSHIDLCIVSLSMLID